MQDSREGWRYLEQRFGVRRNELSDYNLQRSSGDFWLLTEEIDLETMTAGLRFLRDTGRGLKPTTYALQFLNGMIEKNVVSVYRGELKKLLRRQQMIPRKRDSQGYVALKFGNMIIGCGYYKDGKVSSRVPKARGEELADIMEAKD